MSNIDTLKEKAEAIKGQINIVDGVATLTDEGVDTLFSPELQEQSQAVMASIAEARDAATIAIGELGIEHMIKNKDCDVIRGRINLSKGLSLSVTQSRDGAHGAGAISTTISIKTNGAKAKSARAHISELATKMFAK